MPGWPDPIPASGKSIIYLAMICALSGCAGPQNRCVEPLSQDCRHSTSLWQDAIDTVVSRNFPQDTGLFRAVVWEDNFDNAWVVKGREVNITKQFLYKLSPAHRLAVAAHELGHLKLGHYFSKIGIILVDPSLNDKTPTRGSPGHYRGNIPEPIPQGFGKEQEEEADRLAVRFLEHAGLPPRVYLDLLQWLQNGASPDEREISGRISYLKKFISSHPPENPSGEKK